MKKSVYGLFVLVVMLHGGLLGSNKALAQPSNVPNPNTWVTDGAVYAVAAADTITYIGGSFSIVGPNTGHGAAISTTTGKAISPYFSVNDSVFAAVSDGSGEWYIGGSFTMVGSVERNRIAHILSNGKLDTSWNPSANSIVRALAVSGGIVYAGGDFTNIGGQPRNRIAANESYGIHQPWIHLHDVGMFNDTVTWHRRPNGQSFAGVIDDPIQFRNLFDIDDPVDLQGPP
jgi:hypothetical protein